MRWIRGVGISGVGLLLACALPLQAAFAGATAANVPVASVADRAPATELRFAEFFQLPIGPRGLQASLKLLALDGQRVHMVGYMARQDGETAVPGLFILAPLPVALGDEDESFADDLPASVLYVHLQPRDSAGYVQHMSGLITVFGTLELGAQPEIDGRTSFVRLRLEAEPQHLAAPTSVSTVSILESTHVVQH